MRPVPGSDGQEGRLDAVGAIQPRVHEPEDLPTAARMHAARCRPRNLRGEMAGDAIPASPCATVAIVATPLQHPAMTPPAAATPWCCDGKAGRGRAVAFDSSRVIAPFAASAGEAARCAIRPEEHTSELQSLMRISYAVFRLKT